MAPAGEQGRRGIGRCAEAIPEEVVLARNAVPYLFRASASNEI